jgi:hypothetical protein
MCNRNFEVSKVDYSSDIYFSHGLSGCLDCMFSFNLKNKRHCIGNLPLPKEKYLSIKAKLLEDMGGELERKKRLPSLEQLASSSKPDYSGVRRACASKATGVQEKPSASHSETAFFETGKIVLGQSLGKMEEYEEWLLRSAARFEKGKSCASGENVMVSAGYAFFAFFPKDRLLTLPEANIAGEELKIPEEDAKKLGIRNAPQLISSIAYFCPVWQVGTNSNNIDCPTSMDSANCCKCEINIKSKSCGYCFWPRNSEHLFGCYATGLSSSFCLKCYYSKNLSRCFEVDSGRNLADCYFCHNCENCQDCILCFNVKNRRYAIGNVEFPREEYLKVKKMLLEEVGMQLERTGGFQKSVFALLDAGKGKK